MALHWVQESIKDTGQIVAYLTFSTVAILCAAGLMGLQLIQSYAEEQVRKIRKLP